MDISVNGTNEVVFLDRRGNTAGKVENAACQHFYFSPQYYQKTSNSGLLKVGLV